MAVELAASRLMAPYFSSSQIVYTIIIGTVMIAMALGNVYGGKTADRNPDPAVLYRRMLIAGAWIAAIPFVGRYLILGISGLLVMTVNTNFLVIAAFVSCMLIFVFPLFLLGTVTPSLVRYIMENTEESGEIVGRLGAYNTIGSIIGTFLPTFVTIPSVGTAMTFVIFSAVLMLIALAYFISLKRFPLFLVITLALFLVFSLLGVRVAFAFWDDSLSYEGESVYNYLQVKEEDDRVILSTNVLFGVQSVKMKTDDLTGMYYDYALAAPAMAAAEKQGGEPLDILILGNGTGTFATQCARFFPGCRIDGVEIDGKISSLAYDYFDMSPEVDIFEYDGRAFLQATDNKYDVIMVDAYQDITIPFQMSSVEFFDLVREHLNERGVMVVNMNMHSDGEGSINEYLTNTILRSFSYASSVDVPYNSNRELYASASEPIDTLLERAGKLELDPRLANLIARISLNAGACAVTSPDAYLTDDKAPVEVLGMSMIDSLIREELDYYKDIYRRDGLRGVLDELL
ncbi:MAG: fused MFS/spermidine synthase, partial [Firmicutes bacterium]|nr:fused MFS/spermidine synthase [Bacillota bacterium]